MCTKKPFVCLFLILVGNVNNLFGLPLSKTDEKYAKASVESSYTEFLKMPVNVKFILCWLIYTKSRLCNSL